MTISKAVFDKDLFLISDCPSDFIPANATVVTQHEEGCTIKGFFDPVSGELHIQEVTYDNQQREV